MCRFIVCIVYIHRYSSFLTEAGVFKAESSRSDENEYKSLAII